MTEPWSRTFRERRTDQTVTCAASQHRTRDENSWVLGTPESHRSRHLRRHVSGLRHWQLHSRTLPADDGTLPTDDGTRAADVITELRRSLAPLEHVSWPLGTTRVLRLTRSRRDYLNSEGTRLTTHEDLWELSLRHANGASLRRLTRHSVTLPAVAAYLTAQWTLQHRPHIGAPHPGPGDLPVLLAPHVAGVLVHELVGHALEEHDLPHDAQLLPDSIRVIALPAPGRSTDDEGTPSGPRLLVDNGRTTHTPHDRASAAQAPPHAPPPLGHAWCPPHATRPRLRFPRLLVEPAPRAIATTTAPGQPFIHCTTVGGARYFAGGALVDIARADLVEGTRTRSVPPFRLTLTHSDLARARFATGQDTVEPDGCCVKHGDPLPSYVRCPPLLLQPSAPLRERA